MVLEFLLLGLVPLLQTGIKVASYQDPAFQKRLRQRDFLLQIRLLNSNQSGYLLLRKGRLTSPRKESARAPDLLIEWSDALTALRSLMQTRPGDFVESMHREISSGRLRMELDAASSVWLLLTLREMLVVFADSGWKWPWAVRKVASALRRRTVSGKETAHGSLGEDPGCVVVPGPARGRYGPDRR